MGRPVLRRLGHRAASLLEQRPLPPSPRDRALRRLLDEVLLVLAQHHTILDLITGRDVVQKVELVDEEIVREVHVGNALLLGEDADLGLAILEVVNKVIVDKGALVAEKGDGREEVVLVSEGHLPLQLVHHRRGRDGGHRGRDALVAVVTVSVGQDSVDAGGAVAARGIRLYDEKLLLCCPNMWSKGCVNMKSCLTQLLNKFHDSRVLAGW